MAPKRSREDRARRLGLLETDHMGISKDDFGAYRRSGVAPDDIVDSCAACWSVARILAGRPERLPERPERDARGLSMEIWG